MVATGDQYFAIPLCEVASITDYLTQFTRWYSLFGKLSPESEWSKLQQRFILRTLESRATRLPMHFLSFQDLPLKQVQPVLDRSLELSVAFKNNEPVSSLEGKRIGLIVDDSGWRNTSALDIGAQTLGAKVATLPVSLGEYEDIADIARYCSNWFDLIAMRTPSLKKLRLFAEASDIPLVNLRTHRNHPCETLGDLSFINSMKSEILDLTVLVAAPTANIINSWAEAASVLPIKLIQVTRPGYEIDVSQYPTADIKVVYELTNLDDVDVVITDCWPSEVPKETIKDIQISAEVLDRTPESCLFIPCPPVTRGSEVSPDAMTHKKCVVYDAKAHLLHAQNALLEHLLL